MMNKCIYDSREVFYKSKFGALKSNESVDFKIVLPENISSPEVNLVIKNSQGEEFSHSLIFIENNEGYNVYGCTLSNFKVDVYFYYFDIKNNAKNLGIFKNDYYDTQGKLADEGYWYQLTVYDENFTTPSFIKGKIMYQIFPDRFHSSRQNIHNSPSDRRLHSNWCGGQDFLPNENGEYLNNDYFCGDLAGIEQKLDYLCELGVGCIYLNPIFEAHSNHRYDTANYMRIDPLLGTNENFKRLCEKAKEKGIDIILDGVFSHTGSDSIYFNSKGRYNSIGAYNSQQSPYYNWYTFQSFPNSYSCWWGFISLPEVNELNQNFSNYICGENGVIDYWIKQGAKGFRLDVADELPDEFIQKIKSRIKSIDNENLLIGEVWEDATNKESYGKFRKYLLGKELDSVMNYPFKDSILEFVRFKNAKLFSNKVMTIIENYPKPALDVAMNSLSTHDTVRALTNLAGADCQGKDRIWQFKNFLSPSEYDLGIKMLKISMVLQYFLPGVPCIYYGDEAGVQGYKDPFNRSCFPWGNENKELMTFTKELGRLRLSLDVLIDGGCRFISSDDGIVIFERFKDKEKIVITVDVNNYTFSVKQGD
jgi:cyclomaltodextrinase